MGTHDLGTAHEANDDVTQSPKRQRIHNAEQADSEHPRFKDAAAQPVALLPPSSSQQQRPQTHAAAPEATAGGNSNTGNVEGRPVDAWTDSVDSGAQQPDAEVDPDGSAAAADAAGDQHSADPAAVVGDADAEPQSPRSPPRPPLPYPVIPDNAVESHGGTGPAAALAEASAEAAAALANAKGADPGAGLAHDAGGNAAPRSQQQPGAAATAAAATDGAPCQRADASAYQQHEGDAEAMDVDANRAAAAANGGSEVAPDANAPTCRHATDQPRTTAATAAAGNSNAAQQAARDNTNQPSAPPNASLAAGRQHTTADGPSGQHAVAQPDAAAGETAAPGVGASGGAYSQREMFLRAQEEDKSLSFQYVQNDGDPHNSIWLIALKNIFSKQLPNMPREYIARLVLDRRHRSVAIVRRGRTVVGGITYRAFHKQEFGEIAFCAVTANEQVKGFGTRLMNYTKEYAKTKDGLRAFLTYADNAAVGYFSKQGFTATISLPREQWFGYIKDYDGGTMMECRLDHRVPYTAIPAMLRAQRAALDSRIRTLSRSHIVHPELSAFSGGKRGRVALEDIPGVKEAGWNPEHEQPPPYKLVLEDQTGPQPVSQANLNSFMATALRAMQQHEDAWPFLEPVSRTDVPDYYDIIRDPIDLRTIGERLSAEFYVSLEMFAADLRRMFINARHYNAPETPYFKIANKLEAFFNQYLVARLVME